MKIGILGNMNNIYFSLARYLADEGYDCDLLLFDYEPDHFHPSADTFSDGFGVTVRKLDWGDPGKFFQKKSRIAEDLRPYDFLIGSGTGPSFAHYIGSTLDLFIPYGHDLYSLPFPRIVHPKRQLSYLVHAWHQRKGIQASKHLLFDKANTDFETIFRRLNYQGNRIVFPLPLFYHKEYDHALEGPESNGPYTGLLQRLRQENDLLVVQHARQVWKTYVDPWSHKGNDVLFRGFSEFIARHRGIRSKLLLFEYGIDVAHSKQLIRELNLEDQVVWFPKLPRKHLLSVIRASDLVVGELHHAWNSYCVVLEALSLGKPFMHKRNDADLAPFYEELYPMLQASTPQSVYEGLEKAAFNTELMKEMGEKGREWFMTYCVTKPVQEIKRLINEKQKRLHVH